MNFGLNSNVHVGDAVYHVQTEDRGPAHPFLDTVVYLAGRVVHKRSTNYEKFVRGHDPRTLPQKLHELLLAQHRDIITRLEAGKLLNEENSTEPQAALVADPGDRLILKLLNPKSWLAAGIVTLEIELSESGSGQRIADADVQSCLEHKKERVLCAESRTDAAGRASLRFAMPANAADGAALVVRAADGVRLGELRFRLKAKAVEKTQLRAS